MSPSRRRSSTRCGSSQYFLLCLSQQVQNEVMKGPLNEAHTCTHARRQHNHSAKPHCSFQAALFVRVFSRLTINKHTRVRFLHTEHERMYFFWYEHERNTLHARTAHQCEEWSIQVTCSDQHMACVFVWVCCISKMWHAAHGVHFDTCGGYISGETPSTHT